MALTTKNIVNLTFFALVVFSVLGFSATANAGGSANVTWTCWYNGNVDVLCKLLKAEEDTASPVETAPIPVPKPASTRIVGVKNKGSMLPTLLQVIDKTPIALRDRTINIPLHKQPHDMAFVRLLAEDVMCGNNQAHTGNANCVVNFGQTYAEAIGANTTVLAMSEY